MTDKERGLSAITLYHSFMRAMYPASFKLSLPELLEVLSKMQGGKVLLEGLGLGIRSAEVSDGQVRTAMMNLARAGNGKIPAKYTAFFDSLTKEATKFSFVDATVSTLSGSASDILSGAQSVGDSLLTAGKFLNFVLPAVVILFVFFWLDNKSGGKLGILAGKAGKALK